MSQTPSLFRYPLFRWGIAMADAVMIAAVGFFFVEDGTLQLGIYAVAFAALILTPVLLKQTVQEE